MYQKDMPAFRSDWITVFPLTGVWGDWAFREFDPVDLDALPDPSNGVEKVRAYKREGGGWEFEVTGRNGAVGLLLFDEELTELEEGYLLGELVFEWDKHKDRVRNRIIVAGGKILPQPPYKPRVQPPLSMKVQIRIALMEEDIEAIKKRIAAGEFGIDEKGDNRGITMLMLAARHGKNEALKALIEMGADLEVKGDYDRTALISAVVGHNLEGMSTLIAAGANMNPRNDAGETPLHRATKYGGVLVDEMVRLLIENGAEVDAKTKYGDTALIFAAEAGREEIVKFLVENGADREAVGSAGLGVDALLVKAAARRVEIEAKRKAGK